MFLTVVIYNQAYNPRGYELNFMELAMNNYHHNSSLEFDFEGIPPPRLLPEWWPE